MFFLDLDQFKAVNDAHGHRIGDEVLMAVARRRNEELNPGDTLARLSGDEFVILCEDLDERGQADAIAVRFGAAIAGPFVLSDVTLSLTASIGVAFNGLGHDAPDELIRDADLAMYRSKRLRGSSHDVLDLREMHIAEHQAGLARSLPGPS